MARRAEVVVGLIFAPAVLNQRRCHVKPCANTRHRNDERTQPSPFMRKTTIATASITSRSVGGTSQALVKYPAASRAARDASRLADHLELFNHGTCCQMIGHLGKWYKLEGIEEKAVASDQITMRISSHSVMSRFWRCSRGIRPQRQRSQERMRIRSGSGFALAAVGVWQ